MPPPKALRKALGDPHVTACQATIVKRGLLQGDSFLRRDDQVHGFQGSGFDPDCTTSKEDQTTRNEEEEEKERKVEEEVLGKGRLDLPKEPKASSSPASYGPWALCCPLLVAVSGRLAAAPGGALAPDLSRVHQRAPSPLLWLSLPAPQS